MYVCFICFSSLKISYTALTKICLKFLIEIYVCCNFSLSSEYTNSYLCFICPDVCIGILQIFTVQTWYHFTSFLIVVSPIVSTVILSILIGTDES